MSDFDQNLMQSDLLNPFSPYYINKPTVMDMVNSPEKYLNSTQIPNVNLPNNPNNETIPKTNFFNKKAPDIKRNQPYDCFTIMHNNIAKMKKKDTTTTLISTILVGLGIGFFSGKLIKFPKIKLPKMKLPKFNMPKKFDFKNVAKNLSNSKIGKSISQLTAKAKNFVTKKTA